MVAAPSVGVCSLLSGGSLLVPALVLGVCAVKGGLVPSSPCASQPLINPAILLMSLCCPQTILPPQSEIFCLAILDFPRQTLLLWPFMYFCQAACVFSADMNSSLNTCHFRMELFPRLLYSIQGLLLLSLKSAGSFAIAFLESSSEPAIHWHFQHALKINPAEIEHRYWALYFSCKSNSNSLNAASVWRMATMKKSINFNVTLHG